MRAMRLSMGPTRLPFLPKDANKQIICWTVFLFTAFSQRICVMLCPVRKRAGKPVPERLFDLRHHLRSFSASGTTVPILFLAQSRTICGVVRLWKTTACPRITTDCKYAKAPSNAFVFPDRLCKSWLSAITNMVIRGRQSSILSSKGDTIFPYWKRIYYRFALMFATNALFARLSNSAVDALLAPWIFSQFPLMCFLPCAWIF